MAEDFTHEDEEDWAKPVENDVTCAITPRKTIQSKGFSKDQQRVNVNQQCNQDNHSRTIVHIDLDCYYAQVEMVRNPSLRSKPLGIQQKYLLVTCNYVARSRGVTKLMRITEALKRCPDLVIVSGEDLTHYREMSYKITGILHQFSPLVERLGFDENFVDVTGLVEKRVLQGGVEEAEVIGHQYGEKSPGMVSVTRPHQCTCGCHHRLLIGSHIAQEMRQALLTQLGLTSCAGVAHNKLLAKLVGSTHKPNDQTTLWPYMTSHLMGHLTKATQVPGIGHSTGKKLALLGITTLTELIEAPFSLLKDEFGYQTASIMVKLCQGIDESPVIQSGPPQSISDEDSFKKCSTLQEAQLKITTLLKSLSQRLMKDDRQPHTLRLGVRKYSKTHKWSRESRQCSLPDGMLHSLQSDEATVLDKLLDLCTSLFHKMVDVSQPFHLTLISVGFAKFQTPTTKTSVSDISKFFTPRSGKRGIANESIIKDGCTSVAGAGDFNRLETKQECQDMFKFHTKSNKLFSNDVIQEDKVGSPNKRATVTASSYTQSNTRTRAKLSQHLSSQLTVSCVSNKTTVKNTNRNQTYLKNESEIQVANEKSSLSSPIKAENKCMDDSKTISPKTGTSFFALKSHNIQPELTDSKTSVLEHFGNKMESQKEDKVVTNLSTFLKNGRCQISTSSLRASNDDNSHGHCKVPEEKNEECVDNAEVDSATHRAVPPHIDPSVFLELPADLQEEILNDWWRSNTSPPKSSIDCETATASSEIRLLEFPNIDHSVFEELPPDIQKDVLEQQKQKKRTLASMSPASQKRTSRKRPRNAKTSSEKGTNGTKNKCIKDFFCPK